MLRRADSDLIRQALSDCVYKRTVTMGKEQRCAVGWHSRMRVISVITSIGYLVDISVSAVGHLEPFVRSSQRSAERRLRPGSRRSPIYSLRRIVGLNGLSL